MNILKKDRAAFWTRLTLSTSILFCFIPTNAFANYYGYLRCLNNGGGYFGCLLELADTMAMPPDARIELNSLIENEQREQQFVLKSIQSNEKTCALKGKEAEQGACYMEIIKKAKNEFAKTQATTPTMPIKREALKSMKPIK